MYRKLILALVLAAACVQPADPGEAYPVGVQQPEAPRIATLAPTGTLARIDAATSDADLAAERFGASFDLDSFDDLIVRVRFTRGAPVGQNLALEIYSPGGGLFETHRLPVSGPDVVFIIPVRGTQIGSRPIAGVFGIAAVVDGDAAPVATASVELREPMAEATP